MPSELLGTSNLKYNGDHSLLPPADAPPHAWPRPQMKHLAVAMAVSALATYVISYNLLLSDFEKNNINNEYKYLVYRKKMFTKI